MHAGHDDRRDGGSDDALVTQLQRQFAQERRISAEVLRLMAEVDRRRLYVKSACESMFAFATRVLRMSESGAYKRIQVARAARRFPTIFERVGAGQLHLSGLCVLVPHLTSDNHRDLLDAASGLGKRQIERLVAERYPKPDVATSLRKLPTRTQACSSSGGPSERVLAAAPASTLVLPTVQPMAPAADTQAAKPAAVLKTPPTPAHTVQAGPNRGAPAVANHRRAHRPLQPLSAQRYLLKVSVSAGLCDKLRQSQDLLCGQVPAGDVAAVLERALDALIAAQLKSKAAIGAKPRRVKPAAPTRRGSGTPQTASPTPRGQAPRSRRIPAAIRRAVYQRDGAQCRFVDSDTGHRCQARALLQFHHVVPFARGGAHSVGNILLLCNAHNAYLARRDYGAQHINAAIAARTADNDVQPPPAQRPPGPAIPDRTGRSASATPPGAGSLAPITPPGSPPPG